ncbi:MAG: SMC-Scp complex subunit ScpB [bacterium]
MEQQELKRVIEALIFAADAPLTAERIRETLPEELNGFDLNHLVAELNRDYEDSGRAFFIRHIAGGYQVSTRPELHNWVKKLFLGRNKMRLSHAALETLAIVAFKQPISRVDVAQIRGVNSDGVIGTLLEKKLITISGRSEGVGRPLLYNTTPEFLQYFGVNDLSDLPKPREIEELIGKEGMPEEVLHALSDEKQLELPMNVNAEGQTEAEDLAPQVAAPAPIDEKSEAALAATMLEEIAPAEPAAGQNDVSLESESLPEPVRAPEVEQSLEEEVDAIVVEDPDTSESEATEGESDSSEAGETAKTAIQAMAPFTENHIAVPETEAQFPGMIEPELQAVSEPAPAPAPETVPPRMSESMFLDEAVTPAPQQREKRRKRVRLESPIEPGPVAAGSEGSAPPAVRVIGLDEVAPPVVDSSVAGEIVPALVPVHEFTSEQVHSNQPTIVDLNDVSGALSKVSAVPVMDTGQSEPIPPAPASPTLKKNVEIETPFFVLAPSANGAPWMDDTSKNESSVAGFLRRAVQWIRSTWQKLVGK